MIEDYKIKSNIEKMGEEAIKYYDNIKNDPFIIGYMEWDFGFAFLSGDDTIKYIYIKPSERNKGLCSQIVQYFKIDGASPEVMHIMDKNNLLYDLGNGFKCIKYSDDEIICYDLKLGYQIKISQLGLIVEYNKWNGEYFEIVETIFPFCPLDDIRKKMKEQIEKLKTIDHLKIEVEHNGFCNS